MLIQVFGPGCARCHATFECVTKALAELGLGAQVKKVSDRRSMMQAGVMTTPAVAIDGKIICSGMVPDKDLVKVWLKRVAPPPL